MEHISGVKSREIVCHHLDHPVMVQRPEKMLDIKQFFKNYSRECLKLAISEYNVESAFNIFQPRFILSDYNKDARKFGVKTKMIEDSITTYDHKIKADALSFAADLCAVFVLKHKNQFSEIIYTNALNFLNRTEQYELEGYYLGFGYFIKNVCSNGHYAAMAITDWLDRYLTKNNIVFSIIVKELQVIPVAGTMNVSGNPKRINFTCTYLFDEFPNPRLLEICGDFIQESFSLSSEEKRQIIKFINQKINVNLDELFDLMANQK